MDLIYKYQTFYQKSSSKNEPLYIVEDILFIFAFLFEKIEKISWISTWFRFVFLYLLENKDLKYHFHFQYRELLSTYILYFSKDLQIKLYVKNVYHYCNNNHFEVDIIKKASFLKSLDYI